MERRRKRAIAPHLQAVPAPAERTNLPEEAGRLFGRAAELAAVRRLVQGNRLVTLLGPPGIGKTRLALRAGHETLGLFAGGVLFVDLHAHACLEAGLAGFLGGGNPEAALASRGEALLVLDGADALAGAAAAPIAALLAACPQLRILVTSTVRLGLCGEACHELGPLPLADAADLYEERAMRVAAEPGRHADRHVIEQLVNRLDRLPLAIELAAARARVMRPRQLLARLDDRLDLLRARGATGRHASVFAAIETAWKRLAPWERSALAQCAVFEGGFTLEAAEAIVALAPDAPPVLDVVEALRDRSLVQMDPAEPPRFRMLQCVRAFALRELDDADRVRLRHARWFVDHCRSQVDGTPGTEPLARIAAERENLLAAHRNARVAAPEVAARASLALAPLLGMQGPPELEAEVLGEGVAAARRTGEPLLVARALRPHAVLLVRAGRLDEARAALDECLALAAERSPRLRLHASIEAGRLRFAAGAYEDAARALAEGLAEAQRANETFLEGYAQNLLGMVAEAQGRLEASADAFQSAIDRFRRADSRRYEGLASMNLGVARLAQARLADAGLLFEQAIAAFRAVGDRAGEADAVLNLGCVHLVAGRLDDAEPLLRRGLGLERELGNRRAEAYALGNLGIAAHERGELRSARELLHTALDLCRTCGERHFRANFLPFHGAVQAALGNLPEARADFEEARAYFEALGDPGALRTVDVLEIVLALSSDDADLAQLRATLERPAGRIRSSELAMALRIAHRALAHRAGEAIAPVEHAAGCTALEIGPEAAFFRLPGGAVVDLRRRRAQRLIVKALADHRLAAPGVGLSVEQVFAAGWPGDRAMPSAAAARVYVTIRSLRALGLGDLLLRQDDGYLLDPAHPLRRVTEI